MSKSTKIIAFYLPQFHPIKENNEWWGPGFTEWTNVAKARPLFRGHKQPVIPGELGFYDLRLEQTRLDQAALAKEYGVTGFCYWHYWFAGKRLLERPIEEVLNSKKPDFPFCLGWANESWTGIWHGSPKKVLIEQTYPEGDAKEHYNLLRKYFNDSRYIKIDGKPLFHVYKPKDIPKSTEYLSKLRKYAKEDGFPDLYIAGTWSPNPRGAFNDLKELNLDAAIVINLTGRDSHSKMHFINAIKNKLKHLLGIKIGPKRMLYRKIVKAMLPDLKEFPFPAYNCVIPNWDNTPRSGRAGLVLEKATPEEFKKALSLAFENLKDRKGEDIIFLKSWNEWAEGNYVEPDARYGRAYLEVIKQVRSLYD